MVSGSGGSQIIMVEIESSHFASNPVKHGPEGMVGLSPEHFCLWGTSLDSARLWCAMVRPSTMVVRSLSLERMVGDRFVWQ